ncbi:MAG TPA: type VI secretion system tube protein TssD [Steroidobacteraceae bacterium]|jgi:type VI secretion system secreted protein Hcp
MASSGYLTIVGQKQGAINGGVTQKAHENSILVHAFDVQITSPRDATSGLATGKRQHQPIVILKEIDKSSPLLWNALVNNENLTTWVLKFFDVNPAGLSQQIYSITLTNANIASMDESMLDNEIAANATLPMREQITFTYQKITWTWVDGGITASDDWSSPVT